LDLPADLMVTSLEQIDSTGIRPIYVSSLESSSKDVFNESPSTFSRSEQFHHTLKKMVQKFPDDERFLENWKRQYSSVNELLGQLRFSVNSSTVESMKRDFSNYLKTFSDTFDSLTIPTMIWEKCGVIHYVNKSFRDLISFNLNTPTKLSEVVILDVFSQECIRNYVLALYGNFMNSNSLVFPGGLVVQNASHSRSTMEINVLVWIIIKRDCLGLPLVFVGNFIPSMHCFFSVPCAFTTTTTTTTSFSSPSTIALANLSRIKSLEG